MALLLLVLLPALPAIFILYIQRLPFPYQDDFKAILAFAVPYLQAHGPAAKAFLIATFQYGDYKLIFDNVAVAASLEATHHVSFAFLTALGDFFVFGVFGLLWYAFRQQFGRATSLLYFLPVSLVWFALTYWETLNWAEASLQNLPVVFFALAAMLLIAPTRVSGAQDLVEVSKVRFLAGCVAALLGGCCSPNAFLLAPVGLLLLLSRRAYVRGPCGAWHLCFL